MCQILAAPLTEFNVAVVCQEDVGSLWENKRSVINTPGTRSTAASWQALCSAEQQIQEVLINEALQLEIQNALWVVFAFHFTTCAKQKS